MKSALRRRSPAASFIALAVCVIVFKTNAVCSAPPNNSSTEATTTKKAAPRVEVTISKETEPPTTTTGPATVRQHATCGDWASWAPPQTHPAVVMQVVSEGYVDLERNFIRLMELNSAFTRQHLYLMCLDDASVPIFAAMGIRCVPLGKLGLHSHTELWKTRVRVVSCLVAQGYDVIMSDADALWLGDPMEYIGLHTANSSNVVASRGSYPLDLGREWGSTICMGFILFRATGAVMDTFQDAMERIVLKTGDDQVAINRAALELGIAWDEGSDMRYENSTDVGKGIIASLSSPDGEPFEVTLLPHNRFTRICATTPISNETTIAHCYYGKKEVGVKESWMQEANLWSPDDSSP